MLLVKGKLFPIEPLDGDGVTAVKAPMALGSSALYLHSFYIFKYYEFTSVSKQKDMIAFFFVL